MRSHANAHTVNTCNTCAQTGTGALSRPGSLPAHFLSPLVFPLGGGAPPPAQLPSGVFAPSICQGSCLSLRQAGSTTAECAVRAQRLTRPACARWLQGEVVCSLCMPDSSAILSILVKAVFPKGCGNLLVCHVSLKDTLAFLNCGGGRKRRSAAGVSVSVNNGCRGTSAGGGKRAAPVPDAHLPPPHPPVMAQKRSPTTPIMANQGSSRVRGQEDKVEWWMRGVGSQV